MFFSYIIESLNKIAYVSNNPRWTFIYAACFWLAHRNIGKVDLCLYVSQSILHCQAELCNLHSQGLWIEACIFLNKAGHETEWDSNKTHYKRDQQIHWNSTYLPVYHIYNIYRLKFISYEFSRTWRCLATSLQDQAHPTSIRRGRKTVSQSTHLSTWYLLLLSLICTRRTLGGFERNSLPEPLSVVIAARGIAGKINKGRN